MTIKEDLPGLIGKGRSRVEQEISNARVAGGVRGRPLPAAAIRAVWTGYPQRRGRRPAAREEPDGRASAPALATCGPAPDAADTAIVGAALADYDTLSASQVVRRLESLGPEELRAVQRYEAATRNRRTDLEPRRPAPRTGAGQALPAERPVELARPAAEADRARLPRLLPRPWRAQHRCEAGRRSSARPHPMTAGPLDRLGERPAPASSSASSKAPSWACSASWRPTADGERRGRVECCYVETAARGVGVGASLMDAAVAWCAAAGCEEVDALALPGDRLTKQRLEAAGFTARLLTLSRRLG